MKRIINGLIFLLCVICFGCNNPDKFTISNTTETNLSDSIKLDRLIISDFIKTAIYKDVLNQDSTKNEANEIVVVEFYNSEEGYPMIITEKVPMVNIVSNDNYIGYDKIGNYTILTDKRYFYTRFVKWSDQKQTINLTFSKHANPDDTLKYSKAYIITANDKLYPCGNKFNIYKFLK